MIRVWCALIVVLVLMVFVPTSGASNGGNVLSNGAFDLDVAGWTPSTDATVEWRSMDADGDPGSGSAMVANVANNTTTGGAHQCSGLLEGDQEHLLRSMIFIPSGQSETGKGYLSLRLYDQPNCQGNQVLSDYSSQVFTTTPDQWLESSLPVLTPPGAQSALVWLAVRKNEETGALNIAFDNVSLFAVEIFADGFEGGDLTRWSVTQP